MKNLVNQTHRLCSQSKLGLELCKLKSIFESNGYPVDILNRFINECPTHAERHDQFGPKRCPIYLSLPWKGPWSSSIAHSVSSKSKSVYYAVDVKCVFTTSRAFHLKKDVLPAHQKSNLIYEFECRKCSSRYVGRTTQRLSTRIRQHVPVHLLPPESRSLRPTRGRPPLNTERNYQSAIAKHLSDNPSCRSSYLDSSFKVLHVSKSKSFHALEVLEALFIRNRLPNLCIHKMSVSSLLLFLAPTPPCSS